MKAEGKSAPVVNAAAPPRGKPLSDLGRRVRDLLESGKSVKQISVELGEPYGRVWNAARNARTSAAKAAPHALRGTESGATESPAEKSASSARAGEARGSAPTGNGGAVATERTNRTVGGGGNDEAADAKPRPLKLAAETQRTHAIAERIANGGTSHAPAILSVESVLGEKQVLDLRPAAPVEPSEAPSLEEINALTMCPHCGQPLSKSRYGRPVCRNDACDLWGRFIDQGEAKDGCNCERCTWLRVATAADIEENAGVLAEAQDA